MFDILGRKLSRQSYLFIFNFFETIFNPTEVTGDCTKRRKKPPTPKHDDKLFFSDDFVMFLTEKRQLSQSMYYVYTLNKVVVHWSPALFEIKRKYAG